MVYWVSQKVNANGSSHSRFLGRCTGKHQDAQSTQLLRTRNGLLHSLSLIIRRYFTLERYYQTPYFFA